MQRLEVSGAVRHIYESLDVKRLTIECAIRYGVTVGLSVLQNTVVRTPYHVTLNLFYIITKFGHTLNENKASPLL